MAIIIRWQIGMCNDLMGFDGTNGTIHHLIDNYLMNFNEIVWTEEILHHQKGWLKPHK